MSFTSGEEMCSTIGKARCVTGVGGGISISPPAGCLWTNLRIELLRWLRRRVNAPLDAEDIVSETVYRAFRTLGRDPALPGAALWAWSVKTAAYVIANLQRSSRRQQSLPFPDLVACPVILGSLGRSRAVFLLEVLMARATPAQRRVVHLMERGVTSSREIAAELGCSVRAVEQHRQGLRRALSGAGKVPAYFGLVRFLSAGRPPANNEDDAK